MNVHSQAPTARGEATREAIVTAALELFAERGFHGTAVPEVAKRAGVAAGTIYRHFTGKEQLVNVVYRRCKSSMRTHLVASLRLESEPRALFRSFFGALAEFARTEPVAFAFLELHHHGSYLDADSRELELNILIPIAQFVEQFKAQGILKPHSTEALISMVWGALVGIVKASKLGYVRLTDALIDETERSCWDAIRRTEPLENDR